MLGFLYTAFFHVYKITVHTRILHTPLDTMRVGCLRSRFWAPTRDSLPGQDRILLSPLPISYSSKIRYMPLFCVHPSRPWGILRHPNADVPSFVPGQDQFRDYAPNWSSTATECENLRGFRPPPEANLMHYETGPELCWQGPAKVCTCLDPVRMEPPVPSIRRVSTQIVQSRDNRGPPRLSQDSLARDGCGHGDQRKKQISKRTC